MLKTRTLTALVIVPLGIAMVLLSPTQVLAAITGVFVLIAMWEWTRLAGFRAHPVRSAVMAVVALACVALWIVREARALGAPKYLVARMLGNVAVDGVVGIVPFVGDAFDVMFRANMRNMRLLKKWMDKQPRV